MKISARNVIHGTVTEVKPGAVNGIVKMTCGCGKTSFTSTISMAAIEELGLEVGKEAAVVIKATEIMIGVGEIKGISARNILKGKVEEIKEGAVNGIVKLNIGKTCLSATISMDAIKELELEVGKEACAIIKSTSVMMMA